MLKLQIVTGPSIHLRDLAVTSIVTSWTGSVRRAADPAEVQAIVADIDTRSFFGDPTLWVVRASEAWIKQKADLLMPLLAQERTDGGLVLSAASLDGRLPFAKAAHKAGIITVAAPPWVGLKPWDVDVACKTWIADQLATHAGKVQQSLKCADELYRHCGADADALVAAMNTVAIYVDEGPITPEAIAAVVVGDAERPAWEFSAAVLAGNAAHAMHLLYAGHGMEPARALATLTAEIRKLMACLESNDDGEVITALGSKGRPNLRQARRQAETIGRAALQRMMSGAMRANRQLRTSGNDAGLEIESLVLHARQLLGAGKR